MIGIRGAAIVAGLLAAATPPSAQAQTAGGPPTPAPAVAAEAPSKPTYDLKGFRTARFGMTEAEVRSAIQKDFAVKPDQIRTAPNALERTTALVVPLQALDPGPGPATAAYILGYKSKRLIQVNVVWAREARADAKDENKPDPGPYF